MQWATNEFCIEWCKGDSTATVTAPEGSALNTRLTRLAEEYPDEVDAKNSELFHIPWKWVRINPPRKISEELKTEMTERLKTSHTHNTKD